MFPKGSGAVMGSSIRGKPLLEALDLRRRGSAMYSEQRWMARYDPRLGSIMLKLGVDSSRE